MINQQEIDTIKHGIDLVPLIQERGLDLKKVGKNYQAVCPFHDGDSSPSLTVNQKENLWNCFGCDAGGDNIRFVQLFDKVSFSEAVKRLKINLPKGKAKNSLKKAVKDICPARREKKEGLSVKARKLLTRVVNFYQHCFTEDTQGQEYLKERGITDNRSLRDFAVGFVNGSLREILPDDKKTINDLQELGILNKNGNEVFYNSVVFPLYDQDGNVVSLYGRNISAENKVSHLYLSGSRSGLVNRQAAKRSETIILTESIIDALTLYSQGFKNVIPAYGVNGLSKDHLSLFKSRRTKEIYLAFDNDQAGRDGVKRVTKQLAPLGITSHVIELPEKDVNIFFNRHSAKNFESLLKQAHPTSKEQSEILNHSRQNLYQADSSGFVVGYGRRQYQIKGIQRSATQLKATIKAARDVSSSKNDFELTTIDLYSSRSRQWFTKLCANLFNEPEELLKDDLGRLMTLVEKYQPPAEDDESAGAIVVTEADRKLALEFLKGPEMFSEILNDFDTMGVTGEETNKLVGYLAATSRKLADPLSVMIQSRSAAGKSTMQDAILALIPDEEQEKYTRMSDQALFYKGEESLMNKVLAIEEAEGMGGAAYAIRNIQSAGQITVAVTGKDPATGKMRTENYKVKGPVCVMITTTATDLDQETASRFIFLTIDESSQMTEAIHKMQREAETLEGLIRDKKQESITRKHHAAQRILKPLGVVNPFAKYLSYPSDSLRSRRDHKKYLGLIRAIAFIHQYQREIKKVQVEGEQLEYIEVILDDIEAANQLANEVLGQTMDELAQPSRTLLSLIFKMVETMASDQGKGTEEIFFTRRMIREHTGWTDWQVKTHIKQLEDMEYLAARIGSRGKEYSYILNYRGQAEETDKCFLNLTTVEEIKKLMIKDEKQTT